MKKNFKKTILSMLAFSAVSTACAWEKMTETNQNISVSIIQKKDYVKADTIDGQVKPKQVNTMLFGGGFDASDAAINSQELLAALKRGFNQSANIQSHQYTDIYLDLDGNTATTEGVATICTDCPDVKMNVFNTTNGTPTTVEAVMNLGKHECAHKHFVEIFCRSKEIKK